MNIDDLYQQHQHRLWRLCYHITGSIQDAEDCRQQAFTRMLERPPQDMERDLGPWLVRVATNLAIDRLRHRKQTAYPGTWLPQPAPSQALRAHDPASTSPERAQITRERVSYALMVALEALSPKARAIWLLRDIHELTTQQCAQVMDISQADVKTTLHRARRTLEQSHPHTQHEPDMEAMTRAWHLWLNVTSQASDPKDLLDLLEDEVQLLGDSAGRYATAYRPIIGADHVSRFLMGLSRKTTIERIDLIDIHDTIALDIHTQPSSPKHAPRTLFLAAQSTREKWARFYAISAPDKLL